MNRVKLYILVGYDLLSDRRVRMMMWLMIAPFVDLTSVFLFFAGYWTHDINLVGIAYALLTYGMMPYLILYTRLKGGSDGKSR